MNEIQYMLSIGMTKTVPIREGFPIPMYNGDMSKTEFFDKDLGGTVMIPKYKKMV